VSRYNLPNPKLRNTVADLCEAAASGDIVELRHLVGQGLSIDQGDYDKRTALHLAASEGLLEVVKMLIEELGANHSVVDRWGGTPLDDATRSGHGAVAALLKSHGAAHGLTASMGAYHDPSADLCHAAVRGDVTRVRLLSAQGLSIDQGDYDKRTALHLAASEGRLEVVKMLIEELGANHSVVDRWGGTPLDDAVCSGHDAVANFLLIHGASRGRPAGDQADVNGRSHISTKPWPGDKSCSRTRMPWSPSLLQSHTRQQSPSAPAVLGRLRAASSDSARPLPPCLPRLVAHSAKRKDQTLPSKPSESSSVNGDPGFTLQQV